jgi:general stress protein YciG
MKNPNKVEGGRRAALKNKANDPNFYKKAGRLGGLKSRGGVFTGNPARASELGKIGGKVAHRRGGKRKTLSEKLKEWGDKPALEDV